MMLLISFTGCNQSNPVETIQTPAASIIPEGATSTRRYVENPAVPDSFTACIFKVQAAALSSTQLIDTAEIIVDYMRVYEKDITTGSENLVVDQNYNGGPWALSSDEGGLWERNPYWYPSGDAHTSIDASSVQEGYLYLNIKKHIDKIYLWWAPRFQVSTNKKYIFETRVKIVGKTSIQLGADWWRSMTANYGGANFNNKSAFMSDWYGATSDFIVIKEQL